MQFPSSENHNFVDPRVPLETPCVQVSSTAVEYALPRPNEQFLNELQPGGNTMANISIWTDKEAWWHELSSVPYRAKNAVAPTQLVPDAFVRSCHVIEMVPLVA